MISGLIKSTLRILMMRAETNEAFAGKETLSMVWKDMICSEFIMLSKCMRPAAMKKLIAIFVRATVLIVALTICSEATRVRLAPSSFNCLFNSFFSSLSS